MSKDEVVIYWAPDFAREQSFDWNYLYNNPTNVHSELKQEVSNPGIFLCPAVKDMLKHIFFFSSTVGADYCYNKEDGKFYSRVDNFLGIDEIRDKSFNNRHNVTLSLSWIFFCEEPMTVEITPPYFSNAEHLRYGSVIPGTFDIGGWFRPYNAEFILNKDVDELVIKPNEPLFYAKFHTDKKIVFKRFYMDDNLKRIERSCSNSASVFGKFMSMADRYILFKKTSTDKKTIFYIKKNILTQDK
jgi:hypothetical protein